MSRPRVSASAAAARQTADADLARRDPALPGLATLLDPEALSRALAAAGAALRPERVELDYLRYDPGVSCIAGYRIQSGDRKLRAYAKARTRERADDLRDRVRAASHRDRDAGGADGREADRGDAIGTALLLEPCIAFCTFPRDLRLTALVRSADEQRRVRLVSRLLPDQPELWQRAFEPVRYKPERRYVCRLRAQGGGDFALKFYRRRDFASARRNAQQLAPGDRLLLAGWEADSERHRVAALRWISGPLLRDAIRSASPDLAAVARAAEALAELHAQSASLPRRTPADEVSRLRTSARSLEFLLPGRAARTRALVDRLAAGIAAVPEADALIHGDFYGKQVILAGDRAALIDLDTAARGHPLLDLGLFAAHLERDVVMGLQAAASADAVRDAFVEAYQRAAKRPLPGDLARFTAASLLRLSAYPFRARHSDWPDRVEALLSRVEALLGDVR